MKRLLFISLIFVLLVSLVLSACAPSASGSPMSIKVIQFSSFGVKKDGFSLPQKLNAPSAELEKLTNEWSMKNPKTLDQHDLSRIFSLGYDYDIEMINNQIRFYQMGSLQAFQDRLVVEAKSTSAAKTKTPPNAPPPMSHYCLELFGMWEREFAQIYDRDGTGVSITNISDEGWKYIWGLAGCGLSISIIDGKVIITLPKE